MNRKKLLFLSVAAILVMGMLTQCGATPTPAVIRETVVVNQTVEVPKEVEVTVEVPVEKEVVITATPEPAVEASTEIVFMDDASGANFQQWFQTIALPSAEEALGLKIQYVVGRDAETFEKMKAWEEGQGDFAVLFVGSTSALLKSGIPLEDLTAEKIPNMAKIDPNLMISADGVPLDNKAVAYWFSSYALVYDSAFVADAPTSWAELYDRREEFKGKIGIVRPDAKSSAAYRQPYTFLNAFYDFTQPFDPDDPAFQAAWAKLKDFYTYATLPLAGEPVNMFENFNAGDSIITYYAMDYSLWSARQGTMPPSTKITFPEEGAMAGSFYMVVPANIPEGDKLAAYKLLNYLLSDDQQVRLVSTMWQYPSTMVLEQVPGIVWEQIPYPDVAKAAAMPLDHFNSDAIEWVKEHGLELVPAE
jgi:ABC-type uncharacterized transport system YnjBCD substrate-binding protein